MPESEIHLRSGSYGMPDTVIATGPLVFRGAGLVPVGDGLTLGAQDSDGVDRVHRDVLGDYGAASSTRIVNSPGTRPFPLKGR